MKLVFSTLAMVGIGMGTLFLWHVCHLPHVSVPLSWVIAGGLSITAVGALK